MGNPPERNSPPTLDYQSSLDSAYLARKKAVRHARGNGRGFILLSFFLSFLMAPLSDGIAANHWIVLLIAALYILCFVVCGILCEIAAIKIWRSSPTWERILIASFYTQGGAMGGLILLIIADVAVNAVGPGAFTASTIMTIVVLLPIIGIILLLIGSQLRGIKYVKDAQRFGRAIPPDDRKRMLHL